MDHSSTDFYYFAADSQTISVINYSALKYYKLRTVMHPEPCKSYRYSNTHHVLQDYNEGSLNAECFDTP